MRIMILGAGAVGGYFGGRLVEAGADVSFLVREARQRQLIRDGLIIESPSGNLTLPVTTIASGTSSEEVSVPPDVIVVACKAYGLAGALSAISPYVGPNTLIIPLLNGVAHLDNITQRFPEAVRCGGVAQIGVTLTPDGVIKHLSAFHTLLFGLCDGSHNSQAEKFLAALALTSVDARLRPDIMQDLWNKVVFLATLAGGTCVMRASIGTILKTNFGERIILSLLQECSAIAAAEGFIPDAKQISGYRDLLTDTGSSMTASMLRDLESGGPTEAEHIIGDMVSRATKFGISTPTLDIAYTHLQAYELSR